MAKYIVEYEYIVSGHCEVEAESSVEAKQIYVDADDYGDYERVIKRQARKTVKI